MAWPDDATKNVETWIFPKVQASAREINQIPQILNFSAAANAQARRTMSSK